MLDYFSDELSLTIFGFLPTCQQLQYSGVSKDWDRLLNDDHIWKKYGAKSKHDYVNRIKLLSADLKCLVLNEIYSLSFAEDIQRLCKLKITERQAELLSDVDINSMPQQHHVRIGYLDALLSAPYGIMALKENLVTPKQIANMKDAEYIKELLSRNGLIALREKLVTPETANTIKSATHCHYLFKENGRIALKKQLITIEQINKFSQARSLKFLLSPPGLKALQEGVIAPEEAAQLQRACILRVLLSANGIKALRMKAIAVGEADCFISVSYLEEHLNNLITEHETGHYIRFS